MARVSHAIDRVSVSFDEANLVANAGLVLVATVALRLGLEDLVNATVRLAGRVGGSRPWAITVNQTRMASALAAKRRNQPRTVEGGAPAAAAARRWPSPDALASIHRLTSA